MEFVRQYIWQRREPKPIPGNPVALVGRGATVATPISNWRLLEADIVDCLQQHGLKITHDNFGNPHCGTMNIHELALELSERGVMVMATSVAVNAQGNLSF